MTTTARTVAETDNTTTGQVEGIFITTAAFQPMQPLKSARAIAGAGLDGDRYALSTGFYSDGQDGRQPTLIEAEDLERLEARARRPACPTRVPPQHRHTWHRARAADRETLPGRRCPLRGHPRLPALQPPGGN